MKELVLILHNIRSAHNVGSAFRTADAAGVNHIYLTGYTPRPTDRFGRIQKNITKTALGAEQHIPWEGGEVTKLIQDLRHEGFSIVSVEQDARAIALSNYNPAEKVALIFGNEVRGVSKQLRDKSDGIVEIPMHGAKESLNVSVAIGVVLFGLRASR